MKVPTHDEIRALLIEMYGPLTPSISAYIAAAEKNEALTRVVREHGETILRALHFHAWLDVMPKQAEREQSERALDALADALKGGT